MKQILIAGAISAVFVLISSEPTAELAQRTEGTAASVMAPRFEVDPFWPNLLPNHWVLGSTVGVTADAQDHIWIIHRPGSLEAGEVRATTNPPIAQCCAPAPLVLRFDVAGNLLAHWGGPGTGYDWPITTHGITSDLNGNLWIAGSGRGQAPAGHRGTFFHDSMI